MSDRSTKVANTDSLQEYKTAPFSISGPDDLAHDLRPSTEPDSLDRVRTGQIVTF